MSRVYWEEVRYQLMQLRDWLLFRTNVTSIIFFPGTCLPLGQLVENYT